MYVVLWGMILQLETKCWTKIYWVHLSLAGIKLRSVFIRRSTCVPSTRECILPSSSKTRTLTNLVKRVCTIGSSLNIWGFLELEQTINIFIKIRQKKEFGWHIGPCFQKYGRNEQLLKYDNKNTRVLSTAMWLGISWTCVYYYIINIRHMTIRSKLG